MYQWLRFVQILQQKESSGAEAEQNCQVIRDYIAGQRHGWISEGTNARGVKCNGIFDLVASDAGVEGVRSASRPVNEPVQILEAGLRKRVYDNLELWRTGCGDGEDIQRSTPEFECDLPSTESPLTHPITQPLSTTSTHQHTLSLYGLLLAQQPRQNDDNGHHRIFRRPNDGLFW